MKTLLVIIFLTAALISKAQYPSTERVFDGVIFSTKADATRIVGNGQVVLFRGYDVINDGNGGFFQYDSLSVVSPGIDAIAPFGGLVAGRYLRMQIYQSFTQAKGKEPVAFVAGSYAAGVVSGDVLYIQRTTAPTITLRVSWQVARQTNTDSLTSITIGTHDIDFEQPAVGGSIDGAFDTTLNANINAQISITVTTKDGFNVSNSFTIKFIDVTYYGVSNLHTYNTSILASLTPVYTEGQTISPERNIGDIVGNQYAWFLFPESINKNKNQRLIINGMDQTLLFTRDTVSITNAFGYKSVYTSYVQNLYNPTPFNFYTTVTALKTTVVPYQYGFNTNAADSSISRLKKDPTKWDSIEKIDNKYKIKLIRYPGGTNSVTYFWDNPDPGDSISIQANKIMVGFFTSVGDTEKVAAYSDRKTSYKTWDYPLFLDMADSLDFTPVIVLNNQFYRDGDSARLLVNLSDKNYSTYDAGGLKADRWEVATQSLINQINMTHARYHGQVYWEIGNECYARMSSFDYALTITNFVGIIKSLYPDDKIIVSVSKGEYQHNDLENDNWNHELVQILTDNKTLYSIDFFAPHIYHRSSSCQDTQAEIDKRLSNPYWEDVYYYLISDAGFPANYFPRLLYTEWNVSKTAPENPCTNTQYNAMLEFGRLLQFRSKLYVAGSARHTWCNYNNGAFLDSISVTRLPAGYLDAGRKDSDPFSFITPQVIADSIFLESIGEESQESRCALTDTYRLVISKTGAESYVQILVFGDANETLDISLFGTVSWTTVKMDNLTARSWNVGANTLKGTATGTINLLAHSFTYFKK